MSAPAPTAKPRKHTLRIEIGFRGMLLAGVAIAVLVAVVVLWPIIVTVVVGLMILGMLAPPVAWLSRKGLGRGWAIAAIVTGIGLATIALFLLLVPRLGAQVAEMVKQLPGAQKQLAQKLDAIPLLAPFAGQVRGLRSNALLSGASKALFAHGAAIVEVGAYGVSAFFIALYLMIDRDRMRGGVFALVPRRYHVRLARVLLKLEEIVGDYLRGQVLTSVLAGSFTFGVLAIFGVPNALALGAFAALADVLPYIGAALVCGPATLAALPRGVPIALMVFGLLALYQEFESRFVVPRVYGRALQLPAVIVMLSLLIGGKLMGILGALLALPIAAGIRMVIEELRVELPGDASADGRVEALDQEGERIFEQLAAGATPEAASGVAVEIAETQIQATEQAAGPAGK